MWAERKSLESTITPTSRSVFLLIAVLLIGFGARIAGFSHLGILQFDEGVYALSGGWSLTDFGSGLYPKQALYSPPLYVFLVGVFYRLAGAPWDRAPILVNILFGAATIPLVWWMARRWVGPRAACAAATFVALSQYHITYSRMALTDILFGYLFLLSLAWIAVALQGGDLRWAVMAGLAVGAAWNTKYHGWFGLVIAFAALCALLVFEGSDRPPAPRLLACWLIICTVAALCYVPWFLHVENEAGGYAVLLKYQRSFLSRHWLANIWRQAGTQVFMDGWLTRLAPLLAVLCALGAGGKTVRLSRKHTVLAALLFFFSGLVLGGATTLLLLGLFAVPAFVRRRDAFGWVLLSAVAFFFMTTPLYRPYGRLGIPFMLGLCVLAGAGTERVLARLEQQADSGSAAAFLKAGIPVLAVFLVAFVWLGLRGGFSLQARTWGATDSVRLAADAMSGCLPAESVVLVHGAPEMVFYLRVAGRNAIPIDDPIDDPKVRLLIQLGEKPYYLLTAIYSQREPRSRASLARLAGALQPIASFPMEPNDARLLDDFGPLRAAQFRNAPTDAYTLRLFSIRSLGEAVPPVEKP